MNIVTLSLHFRNVLLFSFLFITPAIYSGEPYSLSQILVLGARNEINKVADKLRTSHSVRVNTFATTADQTEEKHSEGFLNIYPKGVTLCCSSQGERYTAFSSYDMGIILLNLERGTGYRISTIDLGR